MRGRSWLLAAALSGALLGCHGARPAQAPEPAADEIALGHQALWEDRVFASMRLRFIGNAHAPSKELAKQLTVTLGAVTGEIIARDVMIIEAWYYDHGYIDVRVDPSIDVAPGGDELIVTMSIVEGPTYTIAALDVFEEQNGKHGAALGWKTSLAIGSLFQRKELAEALSTLRTTYRDLGYAYVEADPKTDVDPERRTIRVVVVVHRGAMTSFGHVRIVGATAAAEALVRKELLVSEGARFNETALVKSKERLIATGWFTRVDVSIAKGEKDDVVDVTFEVEEHPAAVFPQIASR